MDKIASSTDGLSLSEYGRINHLSDNALVLIGMRLYGFGEEDIRLMLAIERGEVDGDTEEIPDAPQGQG